MKKSEIYKAVQCAVINHAPFTAHEKLEILRELMAAEDIAIWSEKHEEKQPENESSKV